MMNITKATGNEAERLTSLSIKSEAYWGYDYDFMEKFKYIYKVTEEFIKSNPTFIMEKDGDVIGFYSILLEENEASLEYFYIEPKFIGKGYGKLLWNHMITCCKDFGIGEIAIVTSPQAKAFYTKMGAVQIGEIESRVKKEHKIPQLIYTF